MMSVILLEYFKVCSYVIILMLNVVRLSVHMLNVIVLTANAER